MYAKVLRRVRRFLRAGTKTHTELRRAPRAQRAQTEKDHANAETRRALSFPREVCRDFTQCCGGSRQALARFDRALLWSLVYRIIQGHRNVHKPGIGWPSAFVEVVFRMMEAG